MKEIKIIGQSVELYKVLKFEAIAASGGEAKSIIADGNVKVNDALELRKRRKLVVGDTFEVFGEHYRLTGDT